MEIFLILMIPLMGTTLGSLMVFLMRDKVRVQTEKLLLGFASGVMIAASVWSLLIPSMELSERGYGKMNWVPAMRRGNRDCWEDTAVCRICTFTALRLRACARGFQKLL